LGWLDRWPSATETRLTIAVLPFATQGQEWLGDGIAEDIMTAVSRFRDLTVIGRTSSFRYRGDMVDVRQVGKDLNAHYVLQGSVRREGDRVRISVQLVDARTGAGRWAERYDRPFADVFAIQDDVAGKVAAQLFVHARETTVARLRAHPPANLEVYELALRGRKAYVTFTREGAIEAQALSERAIAIDPNYAPAGRFSPTRYCNSISSPTASISGRRRSCNGGARLRRRPLSSTPTLRPPRRSWAGH
jgi:adenylate cyclase